MLHRTSCTNQSFLHSQATVNCDCNFFIHSLHIMKNCSPLKRSPDIVADERIQRGLHWGVTICSGKEMAPGTNVNRTELSQAESCTGNEAFVCRPLFIYLFLHLSFTPALYLFCLFVVFKSGQWNHMFAAANTTCQPVNQHIVCNWVVTRSQSVVQSDRMPRGLAVAPNNPFSFLQTHILSAVHLILG